MADRLHLPRPDESVSWTGDDPDGHRGRRQLEWLQHYGLRSDSHLLEIGCGMGRLVYHLGAFLTDGSYAGFDVVPDSIAWLNDNYAPLLPNFRFDVVDINNPRFRPDVRPVDGTAGKLRFPYDDGAFDFACAFAVFMHVQIGGFRNYMRELHRVLLPGAVAVVDVMAIREGDPLASGPRAYVPLGDGIYTRFPEFPGHGMAYDEALVRDTFERARFDVVEMVAGQWHEPAPLDDGRVRPGPDTFALRRR